MAKIVEDNKHMLKKLQTASSCYSIEKWENDNKKKKQLVRMICKNSDRFCKNPYFLSYPQTLATAISDSSFSHYNPNAPCNMQTN